MKGLIPNKEKRHFHKLGLHKPIAHLNVGIHQDFIVVDNICGDLDFEDGGNPVVMNRILTAKDPVLCDTFVCQMLYYRREDVPYLVMAEPELCAAFIVSEVEIVDNGGELEIKPEKAEGEKCERCWAISKTVGQCAEHPTICFRCVQNLK